LDGAAKAAPSEEPAPVEPGRPEARLTHLVASASSEPVRKALEDVTGRFVDAMNEDFNTAAAIATLFDLAKTSAGWVKEDATLADLAAAERVFHMLTGDVLGFSWPAPLGGDEAKQNGLIQLLVELRNEARQAKNFALSDQIRHRLAALDVQLKDGPQGTTW
jgi:cysteinyl-tRNA synthetase